MRGKASERRLSILRRRITPAHAGKRREKLLSGKIKQDHPRTCGEKITYDIVDASKVGSPPRMRGKAHVIPIGARRFGITPAHAGKRPLLAVSGS